MVMKELSIEEKAKRYDDLLVKLQEAKVDNDVCDERYCCVIDDIVPELAESEDEKMIQYFKDLAPFDKAEELYEKYGFSHKDAIAWLEKRVEQKPTDKIEPKFKVGDEIRTKNEESLIITRIDRWGYWSEDLFICGFDDADKWEFVEQKPADEEMKEALHTEYEKGRADAIAEMQKPWSKGQSEKFLTLQIKVVEM